MYKYPLYTLNLQPSIPCISNQQFTVTRASNIKISDYQLISTIRAIADKKPSFKSQG